MKASGPAGAEVAVAEVVTLASDLIAIDTTNTGDPSAPGTEREAAEYVAGKLQPYRLSAGTDAKSFDRLGIRHFGFSPLKLPPELDFTALFHGVDERVPVESLQFGTRVLHRLLRTA